MGLPHLRSRLFQTVAFVLDLRVSGSAHEPFKSRFSIPYSSVSCGFNPHCFSKPDILGARFSVPDPRVGGCLMWGIIPSFFEGEFHIFLYSSGCRSVTTSGVGTQV